MKRKIIGFIGAANSGKGTAAKIFKDKGFTEFSFADSVKDAVSNIFGFDRKLLQGDTKKSREFREKEDLYWSKKLGYSVTPRSLLAEFSTDIMRNKFHEDIWINSLEKKLIGFKGDIVISDVRFYNEAKMLKSLGAELTILIRPDKLHPDILNIVKQLQDFKRIKLNLSPETELHRSEWEWVTIPEDLISHTIINRNLKQYREDILMIRHVIEKDMFRVSNVNRDSFFQLYEFHNS